MAAPVLSPTESNSSSKPRGHVKEMLGTDASIFVLKVGTTSLMRPEHQTVNLSSLARLCEAVRDLRCLGHHVIVVTSGAVGVGAQHLALPGPVPLKKRALAAVGQVQLIKYYEDFLGALGLTCAQVLLTLDNLANRNQYLNARTTFTELLEYGVVPIVNENDTVAVQELRFGDNDTLSAQVAALVQADWLFLLTDVDCLYTANPKDDPTATPIYEVEDISRLTADTSTKGTQWGTGGMATKLTAGRIATAAGCTMVICNSNAPESIVRIALGEPRLGTTFYPLPQSLKGRKRWLLSVPVRGQLHLSAAAVRAVRDKHRPLVAAGIDTVSGEFHLQECVALLDCSGREFARGLVAIASAELCALLGTCGRGGGSTCGSGLITASEGGGTDSMALTPSGGSMELATMADGSGAIAGGAAMAYSLGMKGPAAAAAAMAMLPGRFDSTLSAADTTDDCMACDLNLEVVIHRGNLVMLSASEALAASDPEQLPPTCSARAVGGGGGALAPPSEEELVVVMQAELTLGSGGAAKACGRLAAAEPPRRRSSSSGAGSYGAGCGNYQQRQERAVQAATHVHVSASATVLTAVVEAPTITAGRCHDTVRVWQTDADAHNFGEQ